MSSRDERPQADRRRRARLVVGLTFLSAVAVVLVVWLVLYAAAS